MLPGGPAIAPTNTATKALTYVSLTVSIIVGLYMLHNLFHSTKLTKMQIKKAEGVK